MSIKPVIESSIQSIIRPAVGFPAAGVPPVANPILATDHPNLVFMYDMGDTIAGPTLVDLSPNGNDGTITGATVVAGKFGNALSFAGGDDRVDISGYNITATDLAFSGWVALDATVGANSIFMAGETSATTTTPDRLFLSGTTFYISARDGGSGFDSTTWTYGTGVYVHIACNFRGNGLYELFVNGALVASFTASSARMSGGDIALATYYNGTVNSEWNNSLQGDMDRARVFNRALTQEEISALYDEGNP